MGKVTTTAAAELLREAKLLYAGNPSALKVLKTLAARLEEPMRVAVAGMVKSGKSTLLNAIIGEEIAATDASESTKIVTWYRYGRVPKLTLHLQHGEPRELPVRRQKGHLVYSLDGFPPENVVHLVMEWPSPHLENLTLIDTPGLASTSETTSARSVNFLAPDDSPSDVDAVVYLMRHLHSSDVQFLEALKDSKRRYSGSVDAMVVLSRVDEIGAGRIESLVSARQITDRYQKDKNLQRLTLGVLPVAGLLAESARTLRESEYAALAELAVMDKPARERTLLSVDRFLSASQPSTVKTDMRVELVNRFGLFGIRLAVVLIASGWKDAASLAQELSRRSGLDELLELLHGQFHDRAAEMKTRSVLIGVDQLLREQPVPKSDKVNLLLERLLSTSHELREFRLLMRLRSGAVSLPTELLPEAEQLLGGYGTSATTRLGLPKEASPVEIETAALSHVQRWRELSEYPLLDKSTSEAYRTIVRSCEGILEELLTSLNKS